MTQHIYAVVHCESCYNRDGIFTGRVDSLLTENGHQHARQLAQQLRAVTIHSAYRSSLTRTKQTLEHILQFHPHTPVIIDDRIIERDYGELSKKKKSTYQREHPDLFDLYHRSYDTPPPGGESMLQVEARVLPFIADLLQAMINDPGNRLIVAHGNSIRPLRRFFEHLSTQEMMQFENQRDQVFTYDIDPEQECAQVASILHSLTA